MITFHTHHSLSFHLKFPYFVVPLSCIAVRAHVCYLCAKLSSSTDVSSRGVYVMSRRRGISDSCRTTKVVQEREEITFGIITCLFIPLWYQVLLPAEMRRYTKASCEGISDHK